MTEDAAGRLSGGPRRYGDYGAHREHGGNGLLVDRPQGGVPVVDVHASGDAPVGAAHTVRASCEAPSRRKSVAR